MIIVVIKVIYHYMIEKMNSMKKNYLYAKKIVHFIVIIQQ